jgi:RimJ/RimL family protein N-acetyltransferase
MKTRALSKADYASWRILWDQYLVFYEHTLSEEQTQLTFERLTENNSGIHGLVIEINGALVGFAHSSFTHSTWAENQDLYLEDLFIDPAARGKGYGRELIEAVTSFAREHGARKLHWQTHKDNLTAQALYEKLATKSEFVIYEKSI